MFVTKLLVRSPRLGLAALIVAAVAYAHVTVRPKESVAGTSEKYTMRVPTEKGVPTVRIEVEFPGAAEILTLDEKAGWKLEQRKDATGKIVGAIWSGSTILPRAAAEFTFEAKNPMEETRLAWSVIQVYEDGSRSEWTGPAGSRTPASVTVIRKAESGK